MMFNGVFLLLTGVVLCTEGVGGTFSISKILDLIRLFKGRHHGGSGIGSRGHVDGGNRYYYYYYPTYDTLPTDKATARPTSQPVVDSAVPDPVTRVNVPARGDCEWDKDEDFPPNPPLLMDKDTWTSILPMWSDVKRVIRIPSGSSVVIACPGTTIFATGTNVTEGVCSGGQGLIVDGKNYDMKDLGCESRVKETVSDGAESCGYNTQGTFFSIGYEVTGHPFYELFKVCFHKFRENTLYTEHTLRGKSVNAPDKKEPRPSFKKDPGFYTLSPNRCYDRNSQDVLMNILGVNSNIINPMSGLYFAKGQLAPDADFPSKIEADATYRYINAVPQWKIYHDSNWRYMENAVRDLASRRGTDLKVWTGPWGTLEFEDTAGKNVSIYLGLYEEQEVLPAPEVMWKLVYEPSTNRAVVFIVVNRPDVTSFPIELCTNICDQIRWIDFNTNDPEKGVANCCSMEGLRHIIPESTPLKNVGLLTG